MSVNSGANREWRVLETFGPLMSHAGFKNWYLCVAQDGIVAIPLGIGPSIRAGIGAGLGGILGPVIMHAAYLKPSDVEGQRILIDEGNRRWRRYPAELLEKVFVKFCLVGANEIHLQLIGQKNHLYGIGEREQTDPCRAKLRQLFPEVYSEQGFKKRP